MSWISFRGVSTESMSNILVKRMPDHKKAAMRYTAYSIKGRDGELHINEGYATYDLDCEIMIFKASDASNRQMINDWADGTGKLITSDDSAKAYMATAQEIEWTRDCVGGKFYDVALIHFICQPIMREANESEETFTEDGEIVNLGTVESYPLITVHGSGECVFSVAGQEITLANVAPDNPVTIDCDAGYVYTTDGASEMIGEFPVLSLGSNEIVLTSGVTQLDIRPRWGWK